MGRRWVTAVVALLDFECSAGYDYCFDRGILHPTADQMSPQAFFRFRRLHAEIVCVKALKRARLARFRRTITFGGIDVASSYTLPPS